MVTDEVTTEGLTPGVPTAAALPVDVAVPENDDSISSQVKEVVYTTTKTRKHPREEYQPPVHKTTSFSSSGEKSSDNDSEYTGNKHDSESEEDSDQ